MSDPLLNPTSNLPGTGAPTPAGSVTPGHAVHETSFDPKVIAHVILKRLWLLVAIMVAVPTMTWLYVRRLPREYQASASMVIDITTPQYMGQQFREVVDIERGDWWTSREYMETQSRIIQSRSMATYVAHALCERQVTDRVTGAKVNGLQYIFPGISCDNIKAVEDTASALRGMVVLLISHDSRVVQLTAVSNDPEIAALMANTYVDTYITRNLQQRLETSGHAAGWLGSEYVSLQDQLVAAEAKLVKFKTDNNIILVNIEDQQSDIVRKRQRISEELQNIRLKLISLRPLRDYVAQIHDEDLLRDMPAVLQESDVIKHLKTQYVESLQKKVELAGKYLDKHPQVVAQDMRLNAITEELRNEVKQAIKTAELQYDMLQRQELDLRKAVDEATREALGLEVRAIEYNQLKRNFERLRRLTETVGGRETESALASRLHTNNVRMLDAALVPGSPVGPNTQMAVLTALGIAFIVAIGLSFLLEFLDSTVKTQEDMERVLRMPFLGMIPHLPEEPRDPEKPPEQKDLFIARHPKSTVAECCRVIRTNLLFMSPDKPARTLLVTSAGPQEGKSVSSISLALAMAQSGSRVLLVDTDMRRPRLHKVFGIQSGGPGLTSVIAGTGSALEAVRTTEQANLFLLPCGPLPPNPAELLQTDRFRQIVTELGESFDKVIFDSPPIGAVTDALVLSQVTDGVIMVAKSHKTSREMLRRAQRQLQDLNVNMLGCVLNDLDLQNRRKGYGYPYYYYYKSGYYRYGYGYYTSDEEASAEAKPETKPETRSKLDLRIDDDDDQPGPAA